MRVTVAQLRILLTVLRTGSVGAAARQLGLTQSGASQAIIALEKALDADLLTRTAGGVVPTALALALVRDAEIASDAIRRIEATARAAADTAPSRPLRIASVPSTAARLLPDWSRSFRRLYPQIALAVFEGHHLEVGAWVRQGIADIGLAAVIAPDLEAQPIRREELFLVAPPGHALLRRTTAELADLRLMTLVTAGFGCDPILEDLFASAGLAPPRTIPAQDIATALEMVRQGIGLAILPETALPDDLPGLRRCPLSPRAHRQLYLMTRPDLAAPAAIGRFRDLVRDDGGDAARHQ